MNRVKLEMSQAEAELLYTVLQEDIERLMSDMGPAPNDAPIDRVHRHSVLLSLGLKIQHALTFIYGMHKMEQEAQYEVAKVATPEAGS